MSRWINVTLLILSEFVFLFRFRVSLNNVTYALRCSSQHLRYHKRVVFYLLKKKKTEGRTGINRR